MVNDDREQRESEAAKDFHPGRKTGLPHPDDRMDPITGLTPKEARRLKEREQHQRARRNEAEATYKQAAEVQRRIDRNMGTCGSGRRPGCGRDIIWARGHKSNRPMPLDVGLVTDGVRFKLKPYGVRELITETAHGNEAGHQAHWSTCEKADEFRRRG